MPEGTRETIRNKVAEALLAKDAALPAVRDLAAPAVPAAPGMVAHQLKDWQREVRDARLIILAEVRRVAEAAGGILAAENKFAKLAAWGELHPRLAKLAEKANARKGKGRALSASTLRLWRRTLAQEGADALAPLPASRTRSPIPAWLPPLLEIYRQPSEPSLRSCYEDLAKERTDLPSLRTVERTVVGLGKLAVAPGRMLPRELKKLKAYTRRDFDMLMPCDVFTADGHTLDAEVLHPIHGKPFRPEIITILDVATRRCVGWSTGLAEGSWLVADAIRHAVTTHGIPAIFYVDNGCGFKNQLLEGPGLGILCRLGTTWMHSLPYSSQSRGVIEAFQKTWVRAAKKLPAYMGKDMDREARQAIFKASRKDLATMGTTALLLTWKQYGEWCRDVILEYNNRPHSTLPKITDPATGRKRHMTPNELWTVKASEAEIIKPEPEEVVDLFRPYEVRTAVRGLVKLGAKEYFAKALEHFHGEKVQVGYDIHDPAKVWVKKMNGRFICTAELDAHAKAYVPRSMVEEAREKRARGRMNRLQIHMDEVKAELAGVIDADEADRVIKIDPARQKRAAELAREAVAKPANTIPRASATSEKEERIARARAIEEALAQGRDVSEEEKNWLEVYQTTPEGKAAQKMREIFGAQAQ